MLDIGFIRFNRYSRETQCQAKLCQSAPLCRERGRLPIAVNLQPNTDWFATNRNSWHIATYRLDRTNPVQSQSVDRAMQGTLTGRFEFDAGTADRLPHLRQ